MTSRCVSSRQRRPLPDVKATRLNRCIIIGFPPARIKRDLLMRARIRPSRIDYVAGPDGLPRPENSFGALGACGAWLLSRVLEKPTGLHTVDQELNRHLLAFQVVDERGRWILRHVDFEAQPAVGLTGDDILEGSEHYYPGHRYLRNLVAVYFGGQGSDESAYRAIALEVDEEGGKRYKEFAVDKLLSEFIPLSADARNPRISPYRWPAPGCGSNVTVCARWSSPPVWSMPGFRSETIFGLTARTTAGPGRFPPTRCW